MIDEIKIDFMADALLGANKDKEQKQNEDMKKSKDKQKKVEEDKIKVIKEEGVFVQGFEEEQEEIIHVDVEARKEQENNIVEKTNLVVDAVEKIEEKGKVLDEIIKNGTPDEKKEALQTKVIIEEYVDNVDTIVQEVENIGLVKKQENIKTGENRKDNKVQATTVVENTEPTKEDYNVLVLVLEKLEKVIELGEKILEKLDGLLDMSKGIDNKIQVTQNTTNSPSV